MPQGKSGQINMLIQVPLKKRVLLLEWKTIQIDLLAVGTLQGCKEKAEQLKNMVDVNEILELRFSGRDLWRARQTIQSWIEDGPIKEENKTSLHQQLTEYVTSPEIAKLKEENE
ncbi:hypothetical protein BG006_010880, partial [Podila minutissima]